jgi:hypothetical protein
MNTMKVLLLVAGYLLMIGITGKVWTWSTRKLQMLVERRERQEERQHIERLWRRAPIEMAVMQQLGWLPREAHRQLIIEKSEVQPKDQDCHTHTSQPER